MHSSKDYIKLIKHIKQSKVSELFFLQVEPDFVLVDAKLYNRAYECGMHPSLLIIRLPANQFLNQLLYLRAIVLDVLH